MNGLLIQVLLVILAVLAATGLLLGSSTILRYQITPTHLRVTWLGVPVRWLRLDDIKRIGNRPVFWAERWPNTLFDSGRMLVIRRHRGLFRNFVITPAYPFEFKASLEQARLALSASLPKSGVPTNPMAVTKPDGPSPSGGDKTKTRKVA